MIDFEEYRKEDGTVDWGAYQKAQVDAGERCYQCSSLIVSIRSRTKAAGKTLCYGCQGHRDELGEREHESRVRCPQCQNTWDVFEHEDYQVLKEDGDDVCCPDCDYTFHVDCRVEYHLTSPALLGEEHDE
jgi:hypothetical protein